MASALLAMSATADTSVSLVSTLNLKIVLAPNGTLDSPPTWSLSGPGSLSVATDAKSATLVTAGAGISTVTVSATAGGMPLVEHIVATVTVPTPPATNLGLSTQLIPK